MRISSLLLAMLSMPLGLSVSAMPESTSKTVIDRQQTPAQQPSYQRVIKETASMVSNPAAQALATEKGLEILNLTWEDTGRYKNSAVGPNISDMTIQVQHRANNAEEYQVHLMPVIRFPNFSDQSADVRLDDFALKVGNQNGTSLSRVPLRDVLKDLRQYLNQPHSWKGTQKSLLAERDTHVLVSAQASFLPIPKTGKAEFNPVLFNYQSYEGDPAVLTILATREGTSVTVIDNKRDAFAAGQNWGQRLFFNQNGERASLTGERASDFQATGEDQSPSDASAAAEAKGLNLVMLIQVPLKQKEPLTFAEDSATLPLAAAIEAEGGTFEKSSDIEAAIIGHGEVEGPFTEIDNLEIERDPKLPIRVTVQFYKATSNGAIAARDMEAIHKQIARVYEDADYVGSLVVGGETERPTEYEDPKKQPDEWWNKFWERHQENTGQSREDAMKTLRKLLGRW